MNAGRRCALPGCYVVIETETDGRPQRKYCTAAHRAIARQARREGANRSAAAPPLMLPELPLPPLAPTPEAGPARRRRQRTEAAGRRARATAVLGSAGLLVTGGTLMVSSSPPGVASVSAAPWLAADPESEQQWVEEARVSLASLDRQLEEVGQAEQTWQAMPEESRGPQPPATVRALAERKSLLQQQRTSIASELASYESMSEVKDSLTATERHVASLDRALADVPRNRSLSVAEVEATRRLSEQRAMRERQRSAQREELDGLRDSLHEAMSTPLPRDDSATRSITSAVRDLVGAPRRPGRDTAPGRRSGDPDRRPDITAQRGRVDPGRQDVGNGAPQVPGRGLPETPKGPDILAAPPAGNDGGPLDSVRRAPGSLGVPGVGGGAQAQPPGAGGAAPAQPPAAAETAPGRSNGGLLDLPGRGRSKVATPGGDAAPDAAAPGRRGGGLLDGVLPGRGNAGAPDAGAPGTQTPGAGAAGNGAAGRRGGGAFDRSGQGDGGLPDSVALPDGGDSGPGIGRGRSGDRAAGTDNKPGAGGSVTRPVDRVVESTGSITNLDGDSGADRVRAPRPDRAERSVVPRSTPSGSRAQPRSSGGSIFDDAVFDSDSGRSHSDSSSESRQAALAADAVISGLGLGDSDIGEMARDAAAEGVKAERGKSRSGSDSRSRQKSSDDDSDSRSSRSSESSELAREMMREFGLDSSSSARSNGRSSSSDDDDDRKSSRKSRSKSKSSSSGSLERMISRYSSGDSDSRSRYRSSSDDDRSSSKRYKSSSKSKSSSLSRYFSGGDDDD